ncbi:acyl-CoA thioesterase [Aureispira anguillae]|uniref:Acyl-CoA thioesterase n=1 Tax=Aureispira anguillae TaxID=2864201 RepID=A0A915YE20_9BACT|nr:thioesterase family protein [Aureispira anguillae]BDS11344.1 acyl-CoA thioesterase [Aureispira anguillae]
MDLKINVEQPVAWGDMDAFGHVNNTVYLKYFESARVKYFDAIPELAGFHGNEIPVLANISCSYKKPVVYPDTLTMKVGVTSLGHASLKMSCEMISPKVGLAAIAECTIVLIDVKKGHSVRVPNEWRAAIEKIEEKTF